MMFTKQLKFAHHLGSLGTNIATEFSNGSVGPPAADSLTSMPSVMYLQLFWILHLLFSWEIMHYSGLHGS